jgi:hypothetical protein
MYTCISTRTSSSHGLCKSNQAYQYTLSARLEHLRVVEVGGTGTSTDIGARGSGADTELDMEEKGDAIS